MFFFGEKQGLQNREIPINLSEVNQIVSATSRHIKRKKKEKEKFKSSNHSSLCYRCSRRCATEDLLVI